MTAAIELKGVYKNFGATEIIRGVDWTIEAGELRPGPQNLRLLVGLGDG